MSHFTGPRIPLEEESDLRPERDAPGAGMGYPHSVPAFPSRRSRDLFTRLSLVLLLGLLSWLAAQHLFVTGRNQTDGQELQAAIWWIETSVASVGFLLTVGSLPEAGLGIAAATSLLHTSQGWPLLPADLLGALGLYVVALRRPALPAAAYLVGALLVAYVAAGWTVAGYRSPLPSPLDGQGGFPVIAALLVILWFVGASRARGRSRLVRLELQRDQMAREATKQERARMAREVHDVVAHGLSVMVVQAQGGLATLASQPEMARGALEAVVDTGRTSLAEMRRLLDRERVDGQVGGNPAPPAGVMGLPDLVRSVSAAGLPATLRLDLHGVRLPSSIDLAVYRIVQEALTNAIRHAGPGATAAVRVRLTGDRLDLDVTDSGQGHDPASRGNGHGLLGIRERVASLNGALELGPGSNGGFQVHARLPVPLDAP